MATKAHLDGNKRYLTEKVETLAIRVPKGDKTVIKTYAQQQGKSLNAYVVDLIRADMSNGESPCEENYTKVKYKIDLSTVFNQRYALTRYMFYLWEARNKTYRTHMLHANLIENSYSNIMPTQEYTTIFIDEALDLIYIDLNKYSYDKPRKKNFKRYRHILDEFLRDEKIQEAKKVLDNDLSISQDGKVIIDKNKIKIFSVFRNLLSHFDHEKTNAYKKYIANTSSFWVSTFNDVPCDFYPSVSLAVMTDIYAKKFKLEGEHCFSELIKFYSSTSAHYTELLDAILRKFFGEYTNWNDVKKAPGITITLKDNVDIKKFDIVDVEPTIGEKYDRLDEHGKKVIDFLLDEETRRMEQTGGNAEKKYVAKQSQKADADSPKIVATIRYYDIPLSAGIGEFLDSDNYSLLDLFEQPPEHADFVVRISGESMEPTYSDGDKVYVEKMDDISIGEIGAFSVNGKSYIKEKGVDELISHNKDYANIAISEFDSVKCFGRIIGRCLHFR